MPLDTSPEALRVQTDAQRRLGGPKRLALACEMTRTVRQLVRDRIEREHPDLDERGVLDRMLWELYGFRKNS